MVIVLMGVTGSGKTTVGRLLAEELDWQFYDADDFHTPANIEKMKRGVPLNDEDRRPWLETLRDLITGCLKQNINAIVACSALKESYREYLLTDDRVRLIYLKGDYRQIQKRLSNRHGHFMNPALLLSQFDALEEPEQSAHINISESPAEIVKTIKSRLNLLSSQTG